MDIGVAIKDLGSYDIEPLKNKILSLPEEAWWGNQFRQLEYEVHQHTQSIVMVFTDGQGWPNIEVAKDVGWDLLVDEALPLMHQILGDHYPPGRDDYPRDGSTLGGRGNHQASQRQASLVSLRSSHPYSHLHQSQSALHDRWPTAKNVDRQCL